MNILSILDVLRKGSAVTDPALWKTGGEALKLAIIALALSINDLAKAFGHDLHIDQTVAASIGALVAWVVGLFFTVATTDKLGFPAKPADVARPPGVTDAPRVEHPSAPVGSPPADTREADPVRLQPGAPNNSDPYLPG